MSDIVTFPKNDLPPASSKWARAVEAAIIAATRGVNSITNRGENNSSSTTAALARLSGQVNDLQTANTKLNDAVAKLEDAAKAGGSSTVINRSIDSSGAWLGGSRPSTTLSSRSGRISVTFGGSLNSGGGYIVISVVAADGSKTYVSRDDMQRDYGRRVAIQGGASFMPSGTSSILVTVDKDTDVTITAEVLSDNAGVFVGGLNLLAQPAL